jgi:opacity protein-like surface antigen
MRKRHAVAALSLVVAVAFGLPASPAHAATLIDARLEILAFQSPVPITYEWKADVWVPMLRVDAEGYLWNGAYIFVELWGDDPVYDDFLAGEYFTRTTPGLTVADDGIHVNLRLPAECALLNEDSPGGDELYVYASFHDADGGRIGARSNVVSGSYGWCT